MTGTATNVLPYSVTGVSVQNFNASDCQAIISSSEISLSTSVTITQSYMRGPFFCEANDAGGLVRSNNFAFAGFAGRFLRLLPL